MSGDALREAAQEMVDAHAGNNAFRLDRAASKLRAALASEPSTPAPSGNGLTARRLREYPWAFEVCKDCGRDNVVGFSVTDAIWKAVMGDKQGVLCIFCFDERATAKGVEWDSEPVNWWPTSHVAAAKWSHIRQVNESEVGGEPSDRLRELETALRRFGRHGHDDEGYECATIMDFHPGKSKCTCGFAAVLGETPEARPA